MSPPSRRCIRASSAKTIGAELALAPRASGRRSHRGPPASYKGRNFFFLLSRLCSIFVRLLPEPCRLEQARAPRACVSAWGVGVGVEVGVGACRRLEQALSGCRLSGERSGAGRLPRAAACAGQGESCQGRHACMRVGCAMCLCGVLWLTRRRGGSQCMARPRGVSPSTSCT